MCIINRQHFITAVLTVICVTCLYLLPAAALQSESGNTSQPQGNDIAVAGHEDINTLIAELSDKEVRILLLQQLGKQLAASPESEDNAQSGPAELFGSLLQSLSQISTSSGQQARQLFETLPDLGPDLYKIFIAL